MCFRYVGKRTKSSYKREPAVTHEEWAAKHIYFSGTNVSPIPGHFQIKYSPHYIKLFRHMDRPEVRALYAKWASQSGKSLFEVIAVAKKLDTDPANVTLALPIKDDIKKIVERKIDPILKGIKRLWVKFEDYRVAESTRESRALKQLAGGSLLISGSGVKDRKSESLPLLVMDEIGEFDKGAVEEFTERLKAYSKFFPREIGVSTIVSPDDEICTNYDSMEAKMRWEYNCPNPKCEGKHFYPERETFKYISKEEYAKQENIEVGEIKPDKYLKAAKETGHVECPHCYYKITSKEKDQMILSGTGMDWYYIEGDESSTTIGADMNSLGSYFVPFDILVHKLVKAEDDDTKLDKIYRGWFNKFYETKTAKTPSSDIRLLGNGLSEWQIPIGVIPGAIYMGVDSQKDHFWYEIKAYEYGKISHSISSGRVETLNQIEELFQREMKDENGVSHYISKLGIDRQGYVEKELIVDEDGEEYEVETQNNIDMVDEWCMNMLEKYGEDIIYPTVGKEKLSNDMSYQPFILNKDIGKTRTPIPLKAIKLSNINLKTKLQATIDRAILKAKAIEDTEKGYYYEHRLFYVNQDDIDFLNSKEESVSTDYDRQITSETLRYPIKNGKQQKEKKFEKVGRDNHLYDTSVICEMFADMDRIASIIKPPKEIEDNSGMISILTQI